MSGLLLLGLWLGLAGGPEMPEFHASLSGMLGSWQTRRSFEGKQQVLRLALRERDGRLEVRYQLPSEDRIYTSDWRGRCEVKTRLGVKELHVPRYRVDADAARLLVDEQISYKGSRRSQEVRFEGYYQLAPQGRVLELHCEQVRVDDRELPCPPPLVYEWVSDSGEWQD